MAFYTKSYLSNLSERYSQTSEYRNIINENKDITTFDIFLSHSFKDKDYIKGLFYELSKMGFKVYVDWIIDPHFQRDNVTKDTVNQIRKRMKQSKSLIYATSENASSSKWMPWELGFADGDKGRCAILPITEYSSDTFKGQEFLSAYPYVSKKSISNGFSKSNLVVAKSKFEHSSIADWLSKRF